MSTSRVWWLGTGVICLFVSSFHGSMDGFQRSRTVRSCSAGRSLADIPAASERACVVITKLLWPSGASRTPADAPICTRGWLARLAATRTKKLNLAPQARGKETNARQKRAGCVLQMPVRTRAPGSLSTGPHAGELGFRFQGAMQRAVAWSHHTFPPPRAPCWPTGFLPVPAGACQFGTRRGQVYD